MAMTKVEKVAFEALEMQLKRTIALRWPVFARPEPVKDYRNGGRTVWRPHYDYPMKVVECWCDGTYYMEGPFDKNKNKARIWTTPFYASEVEALRALAYHVCDDASWELIKIHNKIAATEEAHKKV